MESGGERNMTTGERGVRGFSHLYTPNRHLNKTSLAVSPPVCQFDGLNSDKDVPRKELFSASWVTFVACICLEPTSNRKN